MSDAVIESTGKWASFRQYEFLLFSVFLFICKSFLLVRLPYRDWNTNIFYTSLILVAFYCYFRFRYKVIPPLILIFFLGAAVGVDIVGNYFHLYDKAIGPVQYDEFSHFITAGFSLPPAMWLLRATTRRFGHRLPINLLAFLSTTITFSFAAYYEILELWDENIFGGKRLHTPTDSANDLQFGLAGIVVAALITSLIFKLRERQAVTNQFE